MERKDSDGGFDHTQTKENNALLSTKLTSPRLHPLFVPRQNLLTRLDSGLDQKLALISSPAGFGKTTLVSEWIAYRQTQGNPPPIAWVSLDPGDNDPARFWRYVLTASKLFDKDLSNSALALLNTSLQSPFQALLTMFINGMAELSTKGILVLEDYHVITSAQVHETLTFFLDHLSPSLHLITITRSDPPLPLARLRTRNELNELRKEDLRFSLEETRIFVEQALPYRLSPEMVARLANRTEGWVAGLRLVTLALQRLKEPEEIDKFLDSFTGSHRPVMDYFIGDVFNTLPESLQQFILQTSVLSRLTGSLCDAITGREDSALILEQLERDNLFLVSLDVSQQWYRFHALFAEAVQHVARQRIGKARLHELSHEASVWYDEHGMLSEAIEAAISVQEWWRAADLIERVIAPRLVQNEYHTLRRWIERLPEEVLRDHPTVCITYASAILFTTDRQMPIPDELIQRPIQVAEEHWRAVDNKPKLGDIMAFRAMVAWRQRDFPGAFSAARQSLQLLPEEAQWRSSSLIFVGLEEMYSGKLNEARQRFMEAHNQSEVARNIYATSISMLNLSEVYARQGALRQAAQLYRQALKDTEQAPMNREDMLIRRGYALVGLSALALEWNDLEMAEQYGTQGIVVAHQIPDESILVNCTILLARLQFIRGEIEKALDLLLGLVAQTNSPLLIREIQAYHAKLAFRAGDRINAQRWYDSLPQTSGYITRIQQELEMLIKARLLIAQGEAPAVLRLLGEWLLEAQDQGRMRSVLEIKIIMSIAFADHDDLTRARQTLIEALILAQPEGYQRIFLDEGEKFAKLLQATLSHVDETLNIYCRALLHTFAQEQVRRAALLKNNPELIVEPLSDQEQRVLRLLSAGHSNPDIASELVISVNTVKTHVKNIYSKLGVNSREQARQTARHLKTH